MANNSGFDIQYFHTGLERGLRIYFFSKPGDPNHKNVVEVDVSQWFQKGLISRIGSIQMLNQYATIGVKDMVTGITRYAGGSVQACFPTNTLTPRFEIWRNDNFASPTSFELVLFENVQPAFAIGAPLP